MSLGAPSSSLVATAVTVVSAADCHVVAPLATTYTVCTMYAYTFGGMQLRQFYKTQTQTTTPMSKPSSNPPA